MNYSNIRHAVAAIGTVALLAACGGGGSSDSGSGGGGSNSALNYSDKPATKADAARFLNQASFGATDADIDSVMSSGYAKWIDKQFDKPLNDNSHRAYMESVVASLPAGSQTFDPQFLFQSWWNQSLKGDDQLRQRTAFALSQILVISFQNDTLGGNSANVRGVGSYYDMLERNAFGNYRQLLDDVTYHPMMGYYLTTMRNTKETVQNGVVTRTPDENYAREVMQLFTIGLLQLNVDGSTKKDATGKEIETYTKDDIAGLAKVFTGLSWHAPAGASDALSNGRFNGGGSPANTDKEIQGMDCYPQYHSISAKPFLGMSIGVQSAATADSCKADIKVALDKLFAHDNIAPFIAERLIKQFTTSNPSPDYIAAVAKKFIDNGSGVRGDLKAVIKEVLLNNEARIARTPDEARFGKLREPLMRVTNFLRATETNSAAVGVNQAQRYMVGYTDSQLQETPMRSGSVFNFWRPGYVPPSSALGDANLTSPEMQVVQEVSVTSYINAARDWVQNGIGSSVTVGTTNVRDLKPAYVKELAIVADSDALSERMNLLYFGGLMSAATKAQIKGAIDSVVIPPLNSQGTNQTNIDNAKLSRVRLAEFLALSSPEYLSQK